MQINLKMEELFNLKVGYVNFKNPIAIATMAGITNSSFAKNHANAGLIVMGGYNLDKLTNIKAIELKKRGREEFISNNPIDFLKKELDAVKNLTTIAVNVRSVDDEILKEVAEIVKEKNAILEIDAHCRQKEMTEIGVGEALLHDIPRLCNLIKKIKKTGVVLSIKIRANVVDDITLAMEIEKAGADIIHVDAMLLGDNADLDVIRCIRNATNLFLIGNNSINSLTDAQNMFSRGSDMISVARGVLKNPLLIDTLTKGIAKHNKDVGWYNPPKHICRGEGDMRGLAFCCLPVKHCALIPTIKDLGLTKEEYINLKKDFAKNTMLEYGGDTCFKSLVWCCKISKPCFLRDGTLNAIGCTNKEYMKLKRELAEHILNNSKNPYL